jgi:hypothetical protein
VGTFQGKLFYLKTMVLFAPVEAGFNLHVISKGTAPGEPHYAGFHVLPCREWPRAGAFSK